MKWVTYMDQQSQHVGFVEGDTVVNLEKAWAFIQQPSKAPQTLLEVIQGGEAVDVIVRTIAETVRGVEGDFRVPLDGVTLLAPIPRPQKNIFCVGKNYAEHAKEMKADAPPENPVIFSKVPTTVIGPEAEIDPHPHVTQMVDYEGELAVVIGKQAKGVKQEEALDYVYGYTLINDVTARDKQKLHLQWLLGKGLDTFCPMGPVLVTADELGDPQSLQIQTRVNGEVRQSASTADMIFDVRFLIETITAGTTLEAGDIVATGTPAGVGMGFEPPKFLQSGDVVEIEISEIGILRNRVR